MSPRQIRIEITIDNPNGGTEYEPLPEGWDDWDEVGRDLHLRELAAEYLAEYAGAAASVTESGEVGARVRPDRPDLYLRSSTGMLHLRSEGGPGIVEDDNLSTSWSRCGLHFDLGRESIPLMVSAEARLCKRCAVIEP